MDAIPSENQDKVTDTEAIDFRFLAENCADILSIVGQDCVIRYISPICTEILGWKPEEMIGHKIREFVFTDGFATLGQIACDGRKPGAVSFRTTIRLKKKSRRYVWISVNGRYVHPSPMDPAGSYVLAMRDITDKKARERKLSLQALTDALTGLGNRRAFDRALRRSWKLTGQVQSKLSLVLLDLDHFKPLNDRYGHTVGDKCLLEIAMAISNAVRAADLVSRWGGDEIAIILPDTDEAGAAIVAEKVRAAIEEVNFEAQEGSGECVSITASIGVATTIPPKKPASTTPHYLLQAADKALYQAKQAGQNRVVTILLTDPETEPAEDGLLHFALSGSTK